VRFFLLFFISCNCLLLGQDPYSKKGEGWQTWQTLERVISSLNQKETLELCSGRMKEGVIKFGMENIAKETKNMQPEFIREFTNKKNDTLYLITKIQGRITALIFKKGKKLWLFDEQTPGDFTSPKEAEKWPELDQIKSQLRDIAQSMANYFSQSPENPLILSLEEMKLSSQINKTFTNPQNTTKEEFLIVKNVTYKGASDLLLAVTPQPLFGKYYATFEDGHIEIISLDFLQKNNAALGQNKKNNLLNVAPEDAAAFLKGLAAQTYKERKKTKLAILKKGPIMIPFLKKHSQHPDLEVRLSIQELLISLTQKPSVIRPRLQTQ
jgi:hypothetical protein